MALPALKLVKPLLSFRFDPGLPVEMACSKALGFIFNYQREFYILAETELREKSQHLWSPLWS